MSEEKNKIDQLFSDAAQSEEAPQYDAAYWNEMEAILNARDQKKRIFLFWAFGGSAAFAVLLFSLYALNNNLAIQKQYVQEEINLNVETSKFLNSENTSTFHKNSSSDKLKSNQAAVLVIDESKASQDKTGINHQNDQQNKNDENSLMNQTGVAEREDNKETNSFNVENDKTSSSVIQRLKKNKGLTEDVEDQISGRGLDGQSKISIELPMKSFYQLKQGKIEDITKSRLKLKEEPRFVFFAKLSGGLMENYKTSRPYESGIIDFSFNFETDLNNVLLRTGVGTQFTTNADLIVSQRAKVYGFGVTNHQNDLSYQQLFDIYIPIEIGYRLNKTAFGIGAQANYLLSTSMDLNHYENNFLVNTDQYHGNTNGLNPFSTQGYLWLEHSFTPKISLGLKVGTNISGRIEDNAYFNNSATTNPIYGQLSFRFNLLQCK